MSLTGMISSALSALQTNSTALDVVSNNIANMNTPGYAKRVVNEQTIGTPNQVSGVDIADVERVVNQYLTQQSLSASATSSQYSAQNTLYGQLNAALGQVGSGTDLPSQVTDVLSALGSAALSPTASTSQQATLGAFKNLASSISSLSTAISGLQTQADQQVVTDVGTANNLIKQIYGLNQQIQSVVASGSTNSSLEDQRDSLIQSLSQMIGVTTTQQTGGALIVSTSTGVNLVGSTTYAQMNYAGGSANGSYSPITIQNIDPGTGLLSGSAQSLASNLGSGEIAGLVQMRDGSLANLGQELGNFAQQTALAYNAQYNANASFPPPNALTGRDTGLLATDSLNFSGDTTIAVTDNKGNLVTRIDVDFDNDTLTVDGGQPQGFNPDIGDFTTAINNALGPSGSASFSNGTLSLTAASGDGMVVQDSSSNPSSRGGTPFSQFFGLNDLFQSAVPSITATGMSANDQGGFNNGGTITMNLEGPGGQPGPQASVTINSGMTIGDIINAMNTAFNGTATFTLSSNGALVLTPSTNYSGYSLNITGDTTQRGSTGLSLSELFNMGSQQTALQANGFEVNPQIVSGTHLMAFAQPQIDANTAAGDSVVAADDNSGLIALQNVTNNTLPFPAAGDLTAQTATLAGYAGAFYQDVAAQTSSTQTNATTASDALTEAQARQSQDSGVNLDEELTNMLNYQQAYSAAARVLSTAEAVYSTLLQIPAT